MTRQIRFLALTVGALSLAACDGVLGTGVEDRPGVRAPSAILTPGGVMQIVLVNETKKSWGYGGCSHRVERWQAGAWVVVDDATRNWCTAVGYSLRPGDEATYQVNLPTDNGTFRVSFRFLHTPGNISQEVWVTSNPFGVGVVTLAN